MAIKDVKVWNGNSETRVYVHTEDGREGCKYLTGNKWHKRFEIDGNLTDEDWKEAKALALWDNRWHTMYAKGDHGFQRTQYTKSAPPRGQGHGDPRHCMDRGWGPCGVCFDCVAE